MTLQMVDRSLDQREGVLEDVLIKVRKFIFPVYFVVIDMEEDKQVPLLFGRLNLKQNEGIEFERDDEDRIKTKGFKSGSNAGELEKKRRDRIRTRCERT